jgi:putative ABC transport system permease protein
VGLDVVASVARMALQLFLVGIYLEYLFTLDSLIVNILWLLLMVVIGANAISTKAKLYHKQIMPAVIIGLCCGLFPILFVITALLIMPSPLYSAQYLIPLSGMLLGNSMTSIIVALQSLTSSFSQRNLEYQGAIALGVSPRYACHPFVQDALKRALAPTLATMSTTGLVTLPGMMTGQILGGVSPLVAIKYQLVIMIAIFIMLSVATTIALEVILKRHVTQSGRINITLHSD